MPDPGEDYQCWSTVADDNGDVDLLIDWHEGQARRTVNNSSRSEMAAHAKNRNLNNGTVITTGLPDAQAFLTGVNYLTIPTGLRATLTVGPGLTNTGPVTLACDGTDAVEVKLGTLLPCGGGEFTSGRYVDLIFNGTFWIFLYSAGNFASTDSPVFTGDPQAPTPPPNDADNSIATTEFVMEAIYGGAGIVLAVKVFNTPGSAVYVPHDAMKSCIVECIGGGGGGGGANAGGGEGWFVGGGGGSGGYSRKLLTGTDIGASQPITVGTGGAGGGGGYPSPGYAGNGSATIFGSVDTPLCKANGGFGGNGASQISAGLGGAGGGGSTVGAIGEITAQGAPGHTGFYHGFEQSTGVAISISSSGGGSSALGGGGTSHSQLSGTPAGSYGSGGSGGGAVGGTASAAGGAGSAGVVIITEFSGSGAVGPVGPEGPQGPTGPTGPTGPSGPGSGDVLRSGTPTAAQIARWTDGSHIEGVAASTITAGFAPLASPTFTGNPQAPTPAPSDADTSIATTGFVSTAISALVIGAAVTDVPTAGRLTYVSATQLLFSPCNGHLIQINGTQYNIATTGILGLANTSVFVNGTGSSNLAVNTTYYVYAFINGGVVTGDFRTDGNGHITDTTSGNVGVEVRCSAGTTPDPTRTLIGMCRTNASSQFVYDAANCHVISWFNRRNRSVLGALFSGVATNSATAVELTTSARANFITWGEEAVSAAFFGQVSNATIDTGMGSALFLDGAAAPGTLSQGASEATAGYAIPVSLAVSTVVAEGNHYFTAAGSTSAPTGVWSGQVSALIRG